MPDKSNPQDNLWPMPKFYFQVTIRDFTMSFQEVSGLDTEIDPIEYRHGNNIVFSTIKMPGLKKASNITMKKGVLVNDTNTSFWDWFSQIKLNTISRETVVIALLDESGSPTMTWTLNNAWPTKVTGADLESDGNEVAIETLEFAHEGLTIL
jgi:phage tail-like protein